MRREIPIMITALSGILMMITYYIPKVENWSNIFLSWFNIITVFAMVLGVLSLVMVNFHKIVRKQPGYWNNIVLLVGLFVTLALGLRLGIEEGTPFYYIFQHVFTPLSATMFSLLAFFIASAAFRAFKAKSLEAGLLLGAAFIVMVGRVPIGEIMWSKIPFLNHWLLSELIEKWIMGCFNTAGQRAILIGATIGLISVSLKILLGVERSYLGGE